MKLIVGFGNPGHQYNKNRHNVGCMFVDYLKEEQKSNNDDMWKKIVLIKPQTFMNESGKEVAKSRNFYKISPDDIFVVHDDLDIRLGEFKIQKGKGPRIHNGILSVEKELNTPDFYRIRIGIDNRNPENRVAGQHYVLTDFDKEEIHTVKEVFKKIYSELRPFLLM